jgi:hypothetical protein
MQRPRDTIRMCYGGEKIGEKIENVHLVLYSEKEVRKERGRSKDT